MITPRQIDRAIAMNRHPSAGRVNRIRYPLPNRLGLITPTPYADIIGGRVIDLPAR